MYQCRRYQRSNANLTSDIFTMIRRSRVLDAISYKFGDAHRDVVDKVSAHDTVQDACRPMTRGPHAGRVIRKINARCLWAHHGYSPRPSTEGGLPTALFQMRSGVGL